MLTYDIAIAMFEYSPTEGTVFWKTGPRRGRAAGKQHTVHKYVYVKLDGKEYLLHRVIWLMQTGKWPEAQIDHINKDRVDNRWENLRAVTHHENMQNKHGKAVKTASGKWRAQIGVNGRTIYLGTYWARQHAEQVYEAAKKLYHPAYVKTDK